MGFDGEYQDVIQFKSEGYEVLKQYVLESENCQQRKVYKISQLKTLQSRSKQAILVGYTSNSYKLWDPQEKKIFVSRDVVFTDLLYHQYKKPQPNNSIIKFKGSTPHAHDQPLDLDIENLQHVPEQTNEDEPMDIDPPENQIQNQHQEAEDINEVTYPVNDPKTYNLRKTENIKPPSSASKIKSGKAPSMKKKDHFKSTKHGS
ncbi:hypothetical protein ONE63_003361 [Megalurothrips usitatus]|uniref:Retroviral polymerase SH3-like domain-containing protein n=1 Tax=Megalurothrips usitatus TaxID=439358 RepID=A0AAV7X9G7_9NEOP|nr:hypothetical protein ONE63_003361 [Megalurothrips usitatus]